MIEKIVGTFIKPSFAKGRVTLWIEVSDEDAIRAMKYKGQKIALGPDEPEPLRPFREPEHEALRQVMDRILDAVDKYRGEERELPLMGMGVVGMPPETGIPATGTGPNDALLPAGLTAPLRSAPADGYLLCQGCRQTREIKAGEPIPAKCDVCEAEMRYERRGPVGPHVDVTPKSNENKGKAPEEAEKEPISASVGPQVETDPGFDESGLVHPEDHTADVHLDAEETAGEGPDFIALKVETESKQSGYMRAPEPPGPALERAIEEEARNDPK